MQIKELSEELLYEVYVEDKADDHDEYAYDTYDPATCPVVTPGGSDVLHVVPHHRRSPVRSDIIIKCDNISWFSLM